MSLVERLVRDDGWIHLSVGITGNATFFAGSICFLPRFSEAVKAAGVWLFIVGSLLMLLGALGGFAARLYEGREERRRADRERLRPSRNRRTDRPATKPASTTPTSRS